MLAQRPSSLPEIARAAGRGVPNLRLGSVRPCHTASRIRGRILVTQGVRGCQDQIPRLLKSRTTPQRSTSSRKVSWALAGLRNLPGLLFMVASNAGGHEREDPGAPHSLVPPRPQPTARLLPRGVIRKSVQATRDQAVKARRGRGPPHCGRRRPSFPLTAAASPPDTRPGMAPSPGKSRQMARASGSGGPRRFADVTVRSTADWPWSSQKNVSPSSGRCEFQGRSHRPVGLPESASHSMEMWRASLSPAVSRPAENRARLR